MDNSNQIGGGFKQNPNPPMGINQSFGALPRISYQIPSQMNPYPIPLNQSNILGQLPLPSIPIGAMGPNFQNIQSLPNYMSFPIQYNFKENNQKRKEFAKGVLVTGFQKTLTVAMLHEYFSKIKTIHAIKLPLSKFKENKGFAFIYFGSEDDANCVKNKLDHTTILRSKIRVNKMAIQGNLSKMMLRIKTTGLSQDQIQERKKLYFNQEKLEKIVQKIIKPIFEQSVEVNKITIPTSKKTQKSLNYARAFLQIKDLQIAYQNSQKINRNQSNDKNMYSIILQTIAQLLNNHVQFKEYASAEIYQYSIKKQSSVIHLKGIKYYPNQDPIQLTNQIKDFIQQKNPQAQIINCYAQINQKIGAWANVTFATSDQANQSYETLKLNKYKFREKLVYGTLKNVLDSRTIVLSTLKKDATEEQVRQFLNQLAEKSKIVSPNQGLRKYDYFSFNILEQKEWFLQDDDKISSYKINELPQASYSWRSAGTIPRRIVINFINDIKDEEFYQFINDLKQIQAYNQLFTSQKFKLANHQKGHFTKENFYVKHAGKQAKKNRKFINPLQRDRNQGPRQIKNIQNQTHQKRGSPFNPPTVPKIDFTNLVPKVGGPPKINSQGIKYSSISQINQQIGVKTQISQPMRQPMGTIGYQGFQKNAPTGMGFAQPLIGQQNMPYIQPKFPQTGFGNMRPQFNPMNSIPMSQIPSNQSNLGPKIEQKFQQEPKKQQN